MKWDSGLYDQQHAFVAEYGRGLLEFVPDDPAQNILDLGCGTGALTAQLAQRSAHVLGVDASPDMIAAARAAFPQLDFQVMDALVLPFRQEWDAVFSNAVFHWIPDHERLLRQVRQALKPNGLLICEFGAQGNIAAIEECFSAISKRMGRAYRSTFNFPSPAAFRTLLEENGFSVERIYDFDRPTPLKGGEAGLRHWVCQFFAAELEAFAREEQDKILDEMQSVLEPALWNGREWVADYRRLRAVARAV
ncbi:MAG: hypothetical protein PWQ55_1086 [Chloroflexota bacterium]|nr:hypothetical protein [Chloroflexota bacterium]